MQLRFRYTLLITKAVGLPWKVDQPPHTPNQQRNEAMATLTETTAARKPSRVYYANLFDQSGTLAKLDGIITFMADATHALTAIEPDMVNFLVVNGECGLANCQQVLDTMHGGAARIATSPKMEG